jgi:hypothetical protein
MAVIAYQIILDLIDLSPDLCLLTTLLCCQKLPRSIEETARVSALPLGVCLQIYMFSYIVPVHLYVLTFKITHDFSRTDGPHTVGPRRDITFLKEG